MALAESLDRMPSPPTTPAERLRVALELHEQGVAMQRANYKRRFPSEPEAEIEARLRIWLHNRA